jgi:hypothetical protein
MPTSALGALLQVPGLVHDQHGILVAEMLDGPLQAPPDVAALARDLTAAGLDAGRAGVLGDGADRAVAAWEGIAGCSSA